MRILAPGLPCFSSNIELGPDQNIVADEALLNRLGEKDRGPISGRVIKIQPIVGKHGASDHNIRTRVIYGDRMTVSHRDNSSEKFVVRNDGS